MIESFVSVNWIGGQILYWFFLRGKTACLVHQYWEAVALRLASRQVACSR